MTQLHAINNFIYVIGDDLFVFILCYNMMYIIIIIALLKCINVYSYFPLGATPPSFAAVNSRSANQQVYVNLDDDVDRGTIILL